MPPEHTSPTFEAFFRAATDQVPFGFQAHFAHKLPALINVPTGLGKTAMSVIGWLWRRHGADNAIRNNTPRRLAYCLPMRVLVEQTRENAVLWLHNLKLLAGKAKIDEQNGRKKLRAYAPDFDDQTKIAVHILMGGEDEDDWDIHPEREAIIIGTQDMLLSRALNRGYAASRARWPMHFGLLHTDCLWVFDEIQLMGSGLATTAQLEAFRRKLSSKDTDDAKNCNGCRSVWMSATMRSEWLSTVDFKSQIDALPRLKLEEADFKDKEISKRWSATKPAMRATATMDDAAALADEIRKTHKQGTRTIVVVNTVKRACELFEKIVAHSSGVTSAHGRKAKADKKSLVVPDTASALLAPLPKIVLLHSRFRPDDRKIAVDAALAPPTAEGTIVVSTQVIEAGVDVSATTLFTELAPWASLVQRFGRCNRKGEDASAGVRWIDLPNKTPEDAAKPYELSDLESSRKHLQTLKDVGLGSLDALNIKLPFKHTHVIRRKDLLDLFDTTPDLAGNDIDIDRYVREIDETDVRVFWRAWDGDVPSDEEPSPNREEICPARIGDFRNFATKQGVKGKVYRLDFLEGKWIALDATRIAPGQVYMIHADAGGYVSQRGWDPNSTARVEPLSPPEAKKTDSDDYDDDGLSRTSCWQTIAQHTDDVCRELDSILKPMALADHEKTGLRAAARWHDWGKAHQIFQNAIEPDGRPEDMAASRFVAKAPGSQKNQAGIVEKAGFWKRYARKHFRHELVSALAVLQKTVPLADADRDLVAYLIAAHHGKARLSIRSFPDEERPKTESGTTQAPKHFARGVWDGDILATTDLGGGVNAPTVTLSLEPMELGLCESPPFVGEPSWIERVLRLRDDIGPFRLAYLEAVLRAADERASAAAKGIGADHA